MESEKLGKVSVGLASRVTDTAPETDLSEAGVAGYAGVQDIGGAFILRRSDNALSTLTWGDVYNHFNGDTANIVRYDSPEIAGFIASAASWGEDDIWDVGLRYSREGARIQVRECDCLYRGHQVPRVLLATDPDSARTRWWARSPSFTSHRVSISPSPPVTANGTARWMTPTVSRARRTIPKYIYAKLGWLAKLNGLGPTAFYGEYGWFKDYVSAGIDADGIVVALDSADPANLVCEREVTPAGSPATRPRCGASASCSTSRRPRCRSISATATTRRSSTSSMSASQCCYGRSDRRLRHDDRGLEDRVLSHGSISAAAGRRSASVGVFLGGLFARDQRPHVADAEMMLGVVADRAWDGGGSH